MEEKIIEIAIKALIDEVIEEGKSLFKNIEKEGRQLFAFDLKEYFQKQKDRYSKVKTLLHGLSPVYIYDVYLPLNLKYKYSVTIKTKSIKSIFKQIGNNITIIGDAGSGKSTLVKHLFLTSIKEKAGIPILIELRYFSPENKDFSTYVQDKIFENKISQNEQILKRLLEKGKFIFFLDGFDEINPDIKGEVLLTINKFMSKNNHNKYILTSRPYVNAESIPLFHNLKISNLSNDEIKQFIDKQIKNEELALKIKNSIIEQIEKKSFIESFLKNPLLLTLYILTYQSNADIPNKKNLFYRRVLQTLFSEHDSRTKLGYVRNKSSKLSQEQFEEILKSFSFLSFFESKFSFDRDYVNGKLKIIKEKKKVNFNTQYFINDLKQAIALWLEDGGILTFSHRSLQEYYTALFVKELDLQNKKKIYEKITLLLYERKINSRNIFLSLCREMESIAYHQCLSIPIIEHFVSILSTNNQNKIVEKIIPYFLKELNFLYHDQSFWMSHDYIPVFQILDVDKKIIKEIYETIYSKDKSIYKILYPNCKPHNPQWIEHVPDAPHEDEIVFVNLENNFPEKLVEFYIQNNILTILERLKVNLQEKLKEYKKLINEDSNINKGLIDLI